MSLSAATAQMEVPDDDRRLAVLIVDDHEVVHWGFRVKLSREPWVSRCLSYLRKLIRPPSDM